MGPTCKETPQENKKAVYFDLLASIIFLLLIYAGVYLSSKLKLAFASESTVAMAVGIVVGGLAYWFNWESLNSAGGALTFSDMIFTTMILPTAMLNLGYNTRYRMLRLNFRPLIAFAIVSVALFFVLFAGIYFVIQWYIVPSGWPRPTNTTEATLLSLFIATIFSAVEPNAQLAYMFEKYNMDIESVQPVLYMLLKWESILSVATMFDIGDILIDLELDGIQGASNVVLTLLWMVVVLTLLALCIGAVFGFLAAFVFKVFDMRSGEYRYQEVGLLLLISYGCFWCCLYLTEIWGKVHVSASLATVTCTAILGNVGWKNISTGARFYYQIVVGGLGHLAEMYSYGILGATLWSMIGHATITWNWSYIFTVFLLSRACRIFVIPFPLLLERTIGFSTPCACNVNYPSSALQQLSPSEKDTVTALFCMADEGGKGYLIDVELQNLLARLGHTSSLGRTRALMALSDTFELEKMSLFECYDMFLRTGFHRSRAKLPRSPGWALKTGFACWLGGVQGHIAFGAAWAATVLFPQKFASKQAEVLPLVWMNLAIGIIVQGGISPAVLKMFGIVPRAEPEESNMHVRHGQRSSWMQFFTHDTKLAGRHTYMRECIDNLDHADEMLRQKQKALDEKESEVLRARSTIYPQLDELHGLFHYSNHDPNRRHNTTPTAEMNSRASYLSDYSYTQDLLGI
uniref:Cation/H+ exchanger transmembrane domain-containing protein n=1 Tax=Eutreptiella gymnastica TaxID=73025 RepID=A0A7S1JGB1_9EUGL|mmetsp:Transcript_91859/g.159339  ORF Transcript_91859/g.159339 Transcript_91859/m.159339 type:complete len:687 (+) Transcript_91859:97-2157(+)